MSDLRSRLSSTRGPTGTVLFQNRDKLWYINILDYIQWGPNHGRGILVTLLPPVLVEAIPACGMQSKALGKPAWEQGICGLPPALCVARPGRVAETVSSPEWPPKFNVKRAAWKGFRTSILRHDERPLTPRKCNQLGAKVAAILKTRSDSGTSSGRDNTFY